MKLKLRLTLGVVLVWMITGCADLQLSKEGFLFNGVTAHRGDSGNYPENTMTAFEHAIRLGVDWIECDVYRSKDGKLVVVHDRTTGRVGDQNLLIAESSWHDLRAVDVAFQFRQQRGLSHADCPVERMPLLEELIRFTQRQSRTRLSIQPKAPIVDEVVELIRKMNAEAWVGFNEGSYSLMKRVKELAPELPVFYDTDGVQTEEHIRQAQQHGFEAVVMYHKNITRTDVEQLHRAGLEAGAWTVNDEQEMERLLRLGIDRVYTDYPKRLFEARRRWR